VARAPAAPAVPLAPEETRVEVELPSDPVRRAWIAARAAYYEDGDLDRAIGLAVRLRADAAVRVESRWAGSLLCEAYTARGRAREAVEVCTEVLPARQGEEARILHRRIAELYRGQLGDCARALPHYNQVLVFGRSSPLDEGARLARAECAAETGDWDLVRRDLLQLENSQIAKSTSPTGDPTEQRAALERIRQRLAQHRAAQAASGMADSE
ncbi:MAG: hypothetical protein KC933_30385, partial [Myxococcales bacterium]|nr:hypothetical protein [Myxococcales bacterium]